MEHAVSDELVERIDEFLGRPAADPHGDPIPTADGLMRGRPPATVPLSTCASRAKVRIARVTNQQPEFLRHLAENGLALGATITVEANSAEAGIVTARIGRKLVSLGHPAAGDLQVEVLSTSPLNDG
jgi:DtxR family Mn-dependent transcriptional regulator